MVPTVDGRNLANQLRLVVYLSIYWVLYIPGGAGFQPLTVPPFIRTSKIVIGTPPPESRFLSLRSSSTCVRADGHPPNSKGVYIPILRIPY